MKRLWFSVIAILMILGVCSCAKKIEPIETTENLVEETTTESEEDVVENNPEDYIVASDDEESEWVDALELVKNMEEYDIVLSVTDLVCDNSTEDLDEFISSSEDDMSYIEENKIAIGIKHAWIGSKLYDNVTILFLDNISNQVGFYIDSDDTSSLFQDLMTEFPNSGEAEKIDDNTVGIDLGDGWSLEMENMSEYGGDEEQWYVSIKNNNYLEE